MRDEAYLVLSICYKTEFSLMTIFKVLDFLLLGRPIPLSVERKSSSNSLKPIRYSRKGLGNPNNVEFPKSPKPQLPSALCPPTHTARLIRCRQEIHFSFLSHGGRSTGGERRKIWGNRARGNWASERSHFI